MNSITQIQDTLDEHKQNIPESVYLKLCIQMKELYNNRLAEENIQTIRVDSLGVKVECLEEQIAYLKHENSKLKCKLESAKPCQI